MLFAEFFLQLGGFCHQFDAEFLQSARQFIASAIPGYPGAPFCGTA